MLRLPSTKRAYGGSGNPQRSSVAVIEAAAPVKKGKPGVSRRSCDILLTEEEKPSVKRQPVRRLGQRNCGYDTVHFSYRIESKPLLNEGNNNRWHMRHRLGCQLESFECNF
eukprot:jgi/Botrbrau1/2943/Bobra.0026s0014.1